MLYHLNFHFVFDTKFSISPKIHSWYMSTTTVHKWCLSLFVTCALKLCALFISFHLDDDHLIISQSSVFKYFSNYQFIFFQDLRDILDLLEYFDGLMAEITLEGSLFFISPSCFFWYFFWLSICNICRLEGMYEPKI